MGFPRKLQENFVDVPKKRSGQRCRAPAVRGWQVCRMHGARGGAPHGNRNGNYKHGGRTKKVIKAGREVNALLRYIRKYEQDDGPITR